MSRKKLTEIQRAFSEPLPTETLTSESTPPESGSLTASLQAPKKKPTKIRFTLDLEKSLDNRLTKAANKLNRPKAEVTRIALERLLEELETEWNN
jgi:hypothetical protein